MAQKKKQQRKKRGGIGREIFAQVERLVAEQEIPRLTAFKQLSAKTGRRVGTVAANYYRVARQQGGKLRRRKRAAGRPRAARATTAARGRKAARGGRLTQLLRELEQIVRSQQAELERLHKENARLGQIRRLIGA
jgi:hypothetical protein